MELFLECGFVPLLGVPNRSEFTGELAKWLKALADVSFLPSIYRVGHNFV